MRPNCKFEHDIATFLASRPADIKRGLPTSSDDLTPVESSEPCPVFLSLGECPYGFKCRFGESHMRKVEEGQGFMQSGWELVVDEEKVAKRKADIGEGKAKRSDRGEMNLITMNEIKAIRGGGRSQVRFLFRSAEAMCVRFFPTLTRAAHRAGKVSAFCQVPQLDWRAVRLARQGRRRTRRQGQGQEARSERRR